MKKIAFTLNLCLFAIIMMAQVPAGFSYQAVVRNTDGEIISIQNVTFKFSILKDSDSGEPVYVETHSAVTNDFGLVNLTIGTGTVISGVLDSGGWDSFEPFLKVEIDPSGGNSFTLLSTTKLRSVPYAFHAQTVAEDMVDDADPDPENELQELFMSNDTIYLTRDGGYVKLPSSGVGGDNWGTQTVETDATLEGEGTSSAPLKIAQQGATSGQALLWSGSTWLPENVSGGGTSLWQQSGSDIFYNSGNVGIGLNNPSGMLEINGNGADSYPQLSLSDLDDYARISFRTISASAKHWVLSGWTNPTDAVSQFHIHYNNGSTGKNIISVVGDSRTIFHGNVGIGSTIPGAKLDINGQIKITGGNPGVGKILTSDASGLASWQVPESNPWQKTGDNIYYNDGNVGIGVTSPRYKLEINGGDYSYIKFFTNVSGTGANDGFVIGTTPSGSSPVWLWNYENSNIHFATNDTRRMDIGADGNVTIMKSLNINGLVSEGKALFVNGTEALWYNGTYFSWGYGANHNYFARPVGIKTNSLADYELVVNGEAAKTGGGEWSNPSDIRLKDILGNYTRGLNDIIHLQPVKFKYKENNPRKLPSDEEQIGFVAQEVQKVFPEAVNQSTDGYLDFNMHSVNVALVNAVKELKEENDRLKSEIVQMKTEYETRLSKLETLMSVYADRK
jgi:hypothetical protein